LSPYAVTKYVNELYADVFAKTYGMQCIGLRYFNVFGPRQDPEGGYAAVIPKWIYSMIMGELIFINGDGNTSRDFCYIENVVQANILAATKQTGKVVNEVYNIAIGERTTLIELHDLLKKNLINLYPKINKSQPVYREFRSGDISQSLASIEKARKFLAYEPTHTIQEGILKTIQWYLSKYAK
jgi:UDP-N-acetylglucosamine 4-epimerase